MKSIAMSYCRFLRFGLALVILTNISSSHAAPVRAPHVSVDLLAKDRSLRPGVASEVGFDFKLDPGWHIYWLNAGDSGMPPSVHWNLTEGVTAGPLRFPAPGRLPLGPLMDYGYQVEVLLPSRLNASHLLAPAGEVTESANVNWLVCREMCIPGKATLHLTLPVSQMQPENDPANAALFERFEAQVPSVLPSTMNASYSAIPGGMELTVRTARREQGAVFYPAQKDLILNAAPQHFVSSPQGFTLQLESAEGATAPPTALEGVLQLRGGDSYEIHAERRAPTGAAVPHGTPTGILRLAGLAFLGGMALNLMPCVFPVLFIKGLSLVESASETRRHMRLSGLLYAAGILVSFWLVVAVLLVLRFGGKQMGWGFQFQSPVFVALMALFLALLGLSLAGQFEIGLLLTSKGSRLAGRNDLVGSFFTGVLATVVATPCTAPFMGAAVGMALAQPGWVALVIFTALALGLALPYLLLTLQPAWTRVLPRPGAWMEIFKQATSVFIFATVIWLVWVFAQLTGVDGVPVLLAALLLAAIAGWILGRWPMRRPATAAAVLVIALAVSLPVYAAHILQLPQRSTEPQAAQSAALDWVPFDPVVLTHDRAQGKAVFVDFTASWCLSCQVNERLVLDRQDVQSRLRKSGVVLMRADWTQHSDRIARALNALGRDGVPTYALYSADEDIPAKVLPEVLTPGIVYTALAGLERAH